MKNVTRNKSVFEHMELGENIYTDDSIPILVVSDVEMNYTEDSIPILVVSDMEMKSYIEGLQTFMDTSN